MSIKDMVPEEFFSKEDLLAHLLAAEIQAESVDICDCCFGEFIQFTSGDGFTCIFCLTELSRHATSEVLVSKPIKSAFRQFFWGDA